MIVLIPVGGLTDGGSPIEGANWKFGNHELELLLYTPSSDELPDEHVGGKYLILERRVRGIATLRCKVGVIDLLKPYPLTLFYDYNSTLVESIGSYIKAQYLTGLPTLEWSEMMGSTFITDQQEEIYSDWKWTQAMLSAESAGGEDDFHTLDDDLDDDDLDESLWG